MSNNPCASGIQSSTQEQFEISNGPTEKDTQSASSNLEPGSSFSSTGTSSGGKQSMPDVGDSVSPTQDKPAASTESNPPKCTSKSPAEVLHHFGLDAEDLEQLISYPEDQITPDNLPLILQEIRTAKSKRAAAEVQSVPSAESCPTRRESGRDCQSLSGSGEAGKSGPPTSDAKQPVPVQTLPLSTRQPLAKVSPVSKDLPTATMFQDHPSATSSLSRPGGTEKSVSPASDFPSSTDAIKPLSIQTLPPSNRQPLAKVSPVTRDLPPATMFQDHPSATSSSSCSGGAGMCQRELSPAVPQLSEVTDCGHTSKYSEGNEVVSTSSSRVDNGGSGSVLLRNTPKSSRHSLESVQRNVRELKRIVLGFSRNQTISDSTSSSSGGSVLSSVGHSSNDQTTQSQTHQNQTSQSIVSSVSLPKKEKETHVLQCTTPKPVILNQPEVGCQSTMKKQPLLTVNPSQPGRVTVDRNDASVTEDHSETKEQGSFPEQIITQPVSLTRETARPPAFPASDSPNVPDTTQPIPIQTLPPSNRQPSAKDVPVALKKQDYLGATPRSFPHTCSLCDEECLHVKDWISHLSTSRHRENCQVFRKEAPGRKERGRGDKRISRSRSPQSSRLNRRSPSSSSSGSSSSSPERQSSQRRRDEKYSSLRRGNYRRSPPRRRCESESQSRRTERRRSSPWRSDKRRSPPRRSDERRSPPRRSDQRQFSPRRSDRRHTSPRRSDYRQFSPRRSEKSRTPPRTSGQRPSPQENEPDVAESLAKKLLEASAVQSLSTPSDLQNVAKLLVPVILDEITKMASSASSSTSAALSSPPPAAPFEAKKKKFPKKPSKAKPSQQTSEATSTIKAKSGKISPPTMVKLQGINSSVSRDDVLDAVENYGKTKSCLLFRAKGEASVCFEKEEDAKKLKSVNSFDVKDTTITVVKEQDIISKEQQRPLQNKPTMSSISTSQTTSTANVSLPQTIMNESTKTNVSREMITSESKAPEVVPEDTSEVVEPKFVTTFKPEPEADHDEATKAEVPEPVGEMGVEESEPLGDGDSAELQEEEEETTASEAAPENSSSLKSLNQHLKNSTEVTMNPEPNSISVKAEPQTVNIQSQPPTSELLEDGSQPFLQNGGQGDSTISESITAGPSDAVMTANEDAEVAETKGEDGSLTTTMSTASTGPASSATVSVTAIPAAVETQIQPSSAEQLDDGTQSLQTSGPGGSTISESITAGPSATATSDAVMKANEDAEVAETKGEDGSLTTTMSTASTSPASSATVSVTAIPAAVETQIQSSELLDDGTQSLQTSGPGGSTISEPITAGATDEAMKEDEGSLFDEQDFNMDDFVTVDEVGEDVEDTEPHSSSSPKEPVEEQTENQSSGHLSTCNETSTNTAKDSKTSSRSSSVSPKTTESETKIGTSSPEHQPPQGLELKPDPVKDETTSAEPTMITRSTRAKRERSTNQAASDEKTQTVGMSTRRSTRSGESQGQKPPKKEEKTPPKRNTPSRRSGRVLKPISKEDVTCDVSDSKKDPVVPHELPATKRKRGRPKKEAKTTRKVSLTLKTEDQDASEKLSDGEATFQTDSVEDKLVGDQPQETKHQTEKSSSLTAPPKHLKEEPEAQMDQVVEDQKRDVEIPGRELETLETLDPFVRKEDGKTNESLMETHPTSQPDTETSSEAGDQEEKPQDERTAETPRTSKRKHEDDSVGEEREPACTEVLPPTPLDASSSLETDPSLLPSVGHQEIQKTEVKVEAESRAITDAGQELQPDHPENQTLDHVKLVGPEAKRARSQSPAAAAKSDNPSGPDSGAPTAVNCRNPRSLHSHYPDSQPPCPETRIQLYDVSRKRLFDNDLTDPNNWGKIAMIRPGRAPPHSPYLHMDAQTATEIKAQSTLVTCFAIETPQKPAAYSDVRVTVYDHLEGPWAEVEEINKAEGPRLMAYLVAPPLDTYLVLPRGYHHTVSQPIQLRRRSKKGKNRK